MKIWFFFLIQIHNGILSCSTHFSPFSITFLCHIKDTFSSLIHRSCRYSELNKRYINVYLSRIIVFSIHIYRKNISFYIADIIQHFYKRRFIADEKNIIFALCSLSIYIYIYTILFCSRLISGCVFSLSSTNILLNERKILCECLIKNREKVLFRLGENNLTSSPKNDSSKCVSLWKSIISFSPNFHAKIICQFFFSCYFRVHYIRHIL